MNQYSAKVLEHFKKPHNFGKIKNPDGVGEVGNVVCGDVMCLYIKILKDGKEEKLKDVKFETFGCAAAIATSSAITDLVKGKNLSEALAINKDQVVQSLGGLPPIKIHCSLLAVDALAEAIYDYLKKNHKTIPADLENRHCKIIKEKEFVEHRYHDWTEAEKNNL